MICRFLGLLYCCSLLVLRGGSQDIKPINFDPSCFRFPETIRLQGAGQYVDATDYFRNLDRTFGDTAFTAMLWPQTVPFFQGFFFRIDELNVEATCAFTAVESPPPVLILSSPITCKFEIDVAFSVAPTGVFSNDQSTISYSGKILAKGTGPQQPFAITGGTGKTAGAFGQIESNRPFRITSVDGSADELEVAYDIDLFLCLFVDMPSLSMGTTTPSPTPPTPPTTQQPTLSTRPFVPFDCPPGPELYFDTFETGYSGWNNARTTRFNGVGSFLGRFAAGDRNPSKTFNVGTNSSVIKVEFDFLEIDSWDGTSTQYGTDTCQFTINGERIDLGVFHSGINEGNRNGESSNGIKWHMKSKTQQIDIIGTRNEYKDQIHTITAYVPRPLYTDGTITITFQPDPSQAVNDESAGFDNILIASCGIPELDTCQSHSDLYVDTFDSDTEGWSNAKLDRFESTGQFLGRYANGDAVPSKTYSVETTWGMVQVEFDFLEIDSWDNSAQFGRDTLQVDINGEILDIGIFVGSSNERHRNGQSPNGVKWTLNSKFAPTAIGGNSNFSDQIHTITAYVPQTLYIGGGSITLRFLVGVNQGLSDESAGFDNIRLSAYDGCSIDREEDRSSSCRSQTALFMDTFDSSDEGWTQAKLHTLPSTGQFLGRFARGDPPPSKAFEVDTSSPFIKVELDFLELDSWDALSTQYGPDTLRIEINGEMVNIGDYNGSRDEYYKNGASVNGIEWTSRSIAPPERIDGTNSQYEDQLHKITMIVPRNLYLNGSLLIRFHVDVTSTAHDESAGFDNIQLMALSDCGASAP